MIFYYWDLNIIVLMVVKFNVDLSELNDFALIEGFRIKWYD